MQGPKRRRRNGVPVLRKSKTFVTFFSDEASDIVWRLYKAPNIETRLNVKRPYGLLSTTFASFLKIKSHLEGTTTLSTTHMWIPQPAISFTIQYTVLPLGIQTLCELHRHVASPDDIIYSIRRLHLKHLDRAYAVPSNLFTMLFCIPP